MAYFGRSPKKPGSVPGAASGGKEQRQREEIRGGLERLERAFATGRQPRPRRADRAVRNARSSR